MEKLDMRTTILSLAAGLLFATATPAARADAVTDWSTKSGELVMEAKLGVAPANRVLAMMHTAVYDAVNAITRRYPARAARIEAAPGASPEAAVAAASRGVLLKTMAPAMRGSIESAYQAALAQLAEGPAKLAGIAVGEKAAAALLAERQGDMLVAETYRPLTTPGVYVPTVLPVALPWPQRKPWLLTSPAQFRPNPPPDLKGALWARDYNEIEALGGKASAQRTPEQTEIARFWEASLPPIYHGVLRSVAEQPGRELTQNARLFAAVQQATDDGAIAFYEAKFTYNFWRPVTAIRNGDIDGNDATERDAAWLPLIDTPLHPEYPCAHCANAAVVGTVLAAEIGNAPMPALKTMSYTLPGVTRSWATVEDFIAEVAAARIYGGLHYRNSTEVGTALGRQVGQLAVAKFYGR